VVHVLIRAAAKQWPIVFGAMLLLSNSGSAFTIAATLEQGPERALKSGSFQQVSLFPCDFNMGIPPALAEQGSLQSTWENRMIEAELEGNFARRVSKLIRLPDLESFECIFFNFLTRAT